MTDALTPFDIGLLGFPVLIALIFLKIPVAAAMALVGLVGTYLVTGSSRVVDSQLKTFAYEALTQYSFSIIPLFLLMSEFATRGGMSTALFRAAEAWIGHRRGGLAMAAIGASAGFGAVCGSSLATASTMGRAALPELRRAGYAPGLATGALAAGGTLGILIPPSVVLVVYALLAEQNIAHLFTAALVPGLLAAAGYMAAIRIVAAWAPETAPAGPRIGSAERWRRLTAVWPVLAIFGLVVGGIYTGAFSPTAAAAVGVAATAALAWGRGALDRRAVADACLATARTSGMIFLIIIGAAFFNAFLAAAQVPQTLAATLAAADIGPWTIVIAMLVFYVVLGTVMDSLAMVFLTVPIFFPIVAGLDLGLSPAEVGVWFGILVLTAAEVGLITPPVGLNLFVINAMAKDAPISATYRGVLPFVASDLVRIALLVAFPALSLGLLRWIS